MVDHDELRTILERLVYTVDGDAPKYIGPDAGIVWDDRCTHCSYCTWRSDDFDVEPEHDDDCPILLGRRALEG